MTSAIKIIKRKQAGDSNNLATCNSEQSVEQSTREMVSTVKSWIAELQQRKRAETHSFPSLPAVVTARRSEYLETLA
jgi:hypothetical protein